MDKTRLSAFADGELSPEEAAEVVMYLADHPGDQAYVDDVMAANAALARAFRAPMDEPVPPALLNILRGEEPALRATVLSFRPRAWAVGGLALAASITAVAFLLPQGADPLLLPTGQIAAGNPVQEHLQSLPSGQPVALATGVELTMLATLPVEGGHCREAEIIDRAAGRLIMALACDRGAGWSMEVALSEPLPLHTDGGYVPAGGVEMQALDLWLDRFGAGAALSPEAEARLIGEGWHP